MGRLPADPRLRLGRRPTRQPPKKLRAALILGDYPDREFLVTRPKGSDPIGNPIGAGGVPRDKVGEFYEDLLNTPQALNHGHTINEYWLENSYGLVGIDMDAFGPYRMDRPEYEYGLAEFGQESACPTGETCDGDFDTELLAKSAADVDGGAGRRSGGRDYDFRFLLHAGYDESGVWQEFGEMRFQNKEAVTERVRQPRPEQAELGADALRAVDVVLRGARASGRTPRPGVMATEGENDGASVYAHEFSHILGVLDNYNNSYANPPQRDYSGPWDMMSRGSFNGPGGSHNRWQVPPTLGATMGSHHMLRDKLRMGFLKPTRCMFLDRNALAATGPVFADVWAREIPLGPGHRPRAGCTGCCITLTDGDKTPGVHRRGGLALRRRRLRELHARGRRPHGHRLVHARPRRADRQEQDAPSSRRGSGSSTPTPRTSTRSTSSAPTARRSKVTKGDYRQLADALFHAGTGPGVVSEYVDEANRLHFYVLGNEARRGGRPVLPRRRALARRRRARPRAASRSRRAARSRRRPGRVAVQTLPASPTPATAEDLIRVKATTADGWATTLQRERARRPGRRDRRRPGLRDGARGRRGARR